MNKLIGLVLILTLAACSKSSPPSQETPAGSEVVNTLDAKDMTITGDLNLLILF